MRHDARIININEYRLAGTPDEFRQAISSMAERTEREGLRGVLSFHFYVNDATGTAGATIIYADDEAWMEHHRMIGDWDERAAFGGTVEFQRATLLGPISDEMTTFIEGAGLDYAHHGDLAAGFVRPEFADD